MTVETKPSLEVLSRRFTELKYMKMVLNKQRRKLVRRDRRLQNRIWEVINTHSTENERRLKETGLHVVARRIRSKIDEIDREIGYIEEQTRLLSAFSTRALEVLYPAKFGPLLH